MHVACTLDMIVSEDSDFHVTRTDITPISDSIILVHCPESQSRVGLRGEEAQELLHHGEAAGCSQVEKQISRIGKGPLTIL